MDLQMLSSLDHTIEPLSVKNTAMDISSTLIARPALHAFWASLLVASKPSFCIFFIYNIPIFLISKIFHA